MVAPEKSEPAAKTAQFAVGMRGYNQSQVDERLAKLEGELKSSARKRDEAIATSSELSKSLSYAQKELADTKAALVRMSSSPSGAGAMAERVRMMMQLAEEEIADLKSAAEADAASTRGEADKYAHESQRNVDKLAKEAQAEREKLLADARAAAAAADAASAKKRGEQDAEAQRVRAAADKKAEDASAAKRAEAERLAAEDVKTRKEQAAAALADANRQQTEATQQRKLALDLRAKVADRLSATDVAVQEAIRLLAPAEEEPAAKAPSPKPAAK
jgi:cell division septum initiation protein DivIVA